MSEAIGNKFESPKGIQSTTFEAGPCSSAPQLAEDAKSPKADSFKSEKLPDLDNLDQWVTAERLREIVWDAASRPSLQWIRKETKRRMIPHLRRGRLIFYRPRSVLEWYDQRESKPATMKPSFTKR